MSESTEALEEQILEDARRRAEPITKRARRQAEEIVRRAERDAEGRREEIRQRAFRRAEAEAQRIRARTELEAENIGRRATEEVLLRARQCAVEALRGMARSKDYPEMLLRLALAATEAMSGRRFELVMRGEDREAHGEIVARALRNRVASELGRQVIVTLADERISAAGGLVVRRADGRQLCEQTFEARLERLWDQLRVEVARALFGDATQAPDESGIGPSSGTEKK